MTLTATIKVKTGNGDEAAVVAWVAPNMQGILAVSVPGSGWRASRVPASGIRKAMHNAVLASTTTVLASHGSTWSDPSRVWLADLELSEIAPRGSLDDDMSETLSKHVRGVGYVPSLNDMPFPEYLAHAVLAVTASMEDASNALDASGILWSNEASDMSGGTALADTFATSDGSDPLTPVTWGNGNVFHPRMMWWGETDIAWVQRVCLKQGRVVAIKGAPGTGKTFLVDAATNGNVISMTCAATTTPEQFYGGWFPTIKNGKQTFEYRPGVWPQAMTANEGQGCTLFLDEAFRIPSEMWGPSYSVTDGRGYLDVDNPDQPRVFAGPNFRLIMAFNPKVEGTFIDKPSWSRIDRVLDYPTDWNVVAKIMGPQHRKIVTVARNLHTHAENGWEGQTLETRDLMQYKQSVEEDGEPEILAVSNLLGKVVSEADLSIWTEAFQSVMGFPNLKPLAATAV